MPAPSADTFARLADLIAIPNASERPTRSVVEVFTLNPPRALPFSTVKIEGAP